MGHASRCSHMILFARSLNSTNRKLSSRFLFHRFFSRRSHTREESENETLFVCKQQQKPQKTKNELFRFRVCSLCFVVFFVCFLSHWAGRFVIARKNHSVRNSKYIQ